MAAACAATEAGTDVVGTAPNLVGGDCAAVADGGSTVGDAGAALVGAGTAVAEAGAPLEGVGPAFVHGGQGGQVGAGGHCCDA